MYRIWLRQGGKLGNVGFPRASHAWNVDRPKRNHVSDQVWVFFIGVGGPKRSPHGIGFSCMPGRGRGSVGGIPWRFFSARSCVRRNCCRKNWKSGPGIPFSGQALAIPGKHWPGKSKITSTRSKWIFRSVARGRRLGLPGFPGH